MAYVTAYGRQCSICTKPATLVVKNRYNAEINYFCASHRKNAEALVKDVGKNE